MKKPLNEKQKFVKSIKDLVENKINSSCNILLSQVKSDKLGIEKNDTKVFDIPVKKIGGKFYYAITESVGITETPFSYWDFSEFSSFMISRLVESSVLTLVICKPTKDVVEGKPVEVINAVSYQLNRDYELTIGELPADVLANAFRRVLEYQADGSKHFVFEGNNKRILTWELDVVYE